MGFSTRPKQQLVFPAYAGMFLVAAVCSTTRLRFPRIRGDVPECACHASREFGFSPHTRGCSPWPNTPPGRDPVFPAYAGMFRDPIYGDPLQLCFPRIRGDVPSYPYWAYLTCLFSPHTRGCSSYQPDSVRKGKGFPRIRGDVPRRAQAEYVKALFSPHTRGCSVMAAFRGGDDGVFPAYAGMFRFA